MKTFTLKAYSDELELSVLSLEPQSPARGTILLVHGMCEHKERYISFMEYLAANGYVAVIYDQRGHGSSAQKLGELGYMRKGGWRAMVEDCRVVAEWIGTNYPNLPHHLLGHSMGSMLVRSFAKRYDSMLDSLIVCGCPSDNPAKGAGLLLARVASLLCGKKSRPKLLQLMSFGSFNQRFQSEGWPCAWVCSDESVLKAYHSDPLCTFIFTANGFEALLGLMRDCYSHKGWAMSKSALPVLFISGADDPCAGSMNQLQAAVDLMGKVGYGRCELRTYEGMRHEILNETRKELVWEDVVNFLNKGNEF